MSVQAATSKRSGAGRMRALVAGVLVLTLAVMALGAAVLIVKLRPEGSAPTKQDQELAIWRDAVDQDPESADAHAGLGVALLRVGQTDEARAEFEAALDLDAANWLANFQLGLLVRDTNPDRAVTLLEAAAKEASTEDRAVILIATGDLLLARGDAKGARDAYQRSIANVAYLFDSHYGLAQAFEQLGERRQAIKAYEEALRFSPGDERITAALDRLRHGDGNGN